VISAVLDVLYRRYVMYKLQFFFTFIIIMDLQFVKMYIDSTLMQRQSDNGNVRMIMIHDTAIRM